METIKIIVADDNIDFSNLLVDFFSHDDSIDVIGAAYNGLQAVELVKTTSPDVVLLDIIMPVMDGFGVLEEINKLPPEDRPQIILISAFGQERMTRIAMALGADFFVIKPVDLQHLAVRIKQLYCLRHFSRRRETDAEDLIESDEKLQICSFLNQLGVPSHLKGYDYIEYAVEIILGDLTALNSIHRKIYTRISQKFTTVPIRVERAIRNAIEQTFLRGNKNLVYDLFGSCLNEKKSRPSNSEFFNIFVNEMRNAKMLNEISHPDC